MTPIQSRQVSRLKLLCAIEAAILVARENDQEAIALELEEVMSDVQPAHRMAA